MSGQDGSIDTHMDTKEVAEKRDMEISNCKVFLQSPHHVIRELFKLKHLGNKKAIYCAMHWAKDTIVGGNAIAFSML